MFFLLKYSLLPTNLCKLINCLWHPSWWLKLEEKQFKPSPRTTPFPSGLPGRRVHIIHHLASAFLIPREALRLASLGKPGSEHVTSLLRIFSPEPSTAATLQDQHRKRFKSGQECVTPIETPLPLWISETQLRAKILSASESFLLNIAIDPVLLWSPNTFACTLAPTSSCVPDTILNASVTWIKSLN